VQAAVASTSDLLSLRDIERLLFNAKCGSTIISLYLASYPRAKSNHR
jgi:hypothetical protein